MVLDPLRLLRTQLDEGAIRLLVRELGSEPERVTVVDRHYFKFKTLGLSLATDEWLTVESVFAYSDGREGFRGHEGELPNAIRLSWSRQRAHDALGKPTRSGGDEEIPMYGLAACWDRYDYPSYSIHIEYHENPAQGISLVTMSTPEATPGREN
jgi:hypothetical protein